MSTTQTGPISHNWTTTEVQITTDDLPKIASAPQTATVTEVNAALARLEVSDIEPTLVPYLAAAAAELALVAGISWRFSVDDTAVALLRLIAKVALSEPTANGPHTSRLHAELHPTG